MNKTIKYETVQTQLRKATAYLIATNQTIENCWENPRFDNYLIQDSVKRQIRAGLIRLKEGSFDLVDLDEIRERIEKIDYIPTPENGWDYVIEGCNPTTEFNYNPVDIEEVWGKQSNFGAKAFVGVSLKFGKGIDEVLKDFSNYLPNLDELTYRLANFFNASHVNVDFSTLNKNYAFTIAFKEYDSTGKSVFSEILKNGIINEIKWKRIRNSDSIQILYETLEGMKKFGSSFNYSDFNQFNEGKKFESEMDECSYIEILMIRIIIPLIDESNQFLKEENSRYGLYLDYSRKNRKE